MGNERPETDEVDGVGDAASTSHLTLTGTAVVDARLVARLGRAAYLGRLVYNAAVDRHVPFAEGLAYRLRLGQARRTGAAPPAGPARSETYLPVPEAGVLGRELTRLACAFPALREFPRSLLDNALGEACRARAAYAKGCVLAKAKGRPMPDLRFRSADDGWTVSVDDFWLLRIGADDARPAAKAQRVPKADGPKRDAALRAAATGERNAARRAAGKARREADWADEKRRCGWNEAKVAAGLARRANRQAADRERQRKLQAERDEAERARSETDEPSERPVRRDSPRAVVGERRMKADVLGLGRFRVDLGREVPDGARKVRLTLHKPGSRGAKVEAGVTFAVPAQAPAHDPAETGRRLHEALRHLPSDATPLDAVEAARAAGVLARGLDLGSRNASTDDHGRKDPPVRWPREDLRTMRALQAELSRKDEAARKAAKVAAADMAPTSTVGPIPTTAATGGPTPAPDATTPAPAEAKPPRRRWKRSRKAERVRARMAALSRRAANRQATRARQDVARTLRRDAPGTEGGDGKTGKREPTKAWAREAAPLVVACDPLRMVAPLLRRPKVRRAATAFMSERSMRTMRFNLVSTRLALRIRLLRTACDALGTLFLTPGHEGTSSTCPACPRFAAKDLRVRVHACPCGFTCDRDHASALVTLGRALLPFRESADPGGAIARASRDATARAAKARLGAERRAAGHAAYVARRRSETSTAGDHPRPPGRGAPGLSVPGPKRVRGSGRNVRSLAEGPGSN